MNYNVTLTIAAILATVALAGVAFAIPQEVSFIAIATRLNQSSCVDSK